MADLDRKRHNERLFPQLQVWWYSNSSEFRFLMLNSSDSVLKIMFSYPPGPRSASAVGSFLLADSMCVVGGLVISIVS